MGTLKIEVIATGLEVGDDLRVGVERRLLYALSRFGAGVERVVVRLSDVPNPLGGFDRRCCMRAWLRGDEIVRVETRDGPAALDRAAGRLASRVEWALVNGRAETGATAPRPWMEPARSRPRKAVRTRLVPGVLPASRKKP